MASEGLHERPTGPPAAGSGPTRAEGRSGRPARPCARPVCILGPPRPALHRTAEGHTPSAKGCSSPVPRPSGALCAAPCATSETSWRKHGRGVIRGLDLGWEAPPSCGLGPRRARRSQNYRARNLGRRDLLVLRTQVCPGRAPTSRRPRVRRAPPTRPWAPRRSVQRARRSRRPIRPVWPDPPKSPAPPRRRSRGSCAPLRRRRGRRGGPVGPVGHERAPASARRARGGVGGRGRALQGLRGFLGLKVPGPSQDFFFLPRPS